MSYHYLLLLLFFLTPAQAGSSEADDLIKIVKEANADTSSDCNQRGGLRVFIVNERPSKIIDIKLDRYFAQIRQPGRSMFARRSGHKLPLGCDLVMDSTQRRVVINAVFISLNKTEKRYGMIY